MKIKKSQVGVVFSLVVGFFLVYAATHNIQVYVPTSNSNPNNETVIVLDAGHGGMDGGCTSVDGVDEKNINLSILLSVRDMCQAFGYNVVVTRDTDISIFDSGVTGVRNQKLSDMNNRVKIFNKYENAVAISIHQNQFTQPQYSGAQMFYSSSNPLNEKLAGVMQGQFVSLLQPENKRETKPTGKDLMLIANTKCPSLMVECGFLSNPQEAALLETKEYQSKVAFTIFTGINKFISENM